MVSFSFYPTKKKRLKANDKAKDFDFLNVLVPLKTDPFCHQGEVDVVAIPSTLLLNACPTTYSKLSCQNTCTQITSLHFAVNRDLWHSFPILLGSANTIQTCLIKLRYKYGTVEEIIKKKTYNNCFERISLFHGLSLLPKCKSNWWRYSLSPAQQYQN